MAPNLATNSFVTVLGPRPVPRQTPGSLWLVRHVRLTPEFWWGTRTAMVPDDSAFFS